MKLRSKTYDQIWNDAIAAAIVSLPFKDVDNKARLRKLYRGKLRELSE